MDCPLACQVLEVAQRHPQDHDQVDERAGEPHRRPRHHHLHLRRDGHAALRQGLRQVRIPSHHSVVTFDQTGGCIQTEIIKQQNGQKICLPQTNTSA